MISIARGERFRNKEDRRLVAEVLRRKAAIVRGAERLERAEGGSFVVRGRAA